MKEVRGLCFSGGGISGISHCGPLKCLENEKLLEKVTHFIGSSAGSIIAALLACKMSIKEIEATMLTIDYTKFDQTPTLSVVGYLYNFLSKYGLYSSQPLEDALRVVLKQHSINPQITFKQVKEIYGSTLIITTTILGKGTFYYSYENSPDMQIVKAVRESCSIPWFFGAIKKDGYYYMDGGVLDDYPINYLYDYLSPDEILGIKLISKQKKTTFEQSPSNIFEFTKSVIQLLRDQALKLHVHKNDWLRTIAVDVGDVSAIDFDLPLEKKLWLIHQGEQAAKTFISNL